MKEQEAPKSELPREVDREYGACALDVCRAGGGVILPQEKKNAALSPEEAKWAASAKETFARYDEDGKGWLSKKELANLLGVISCDFSDEDVDTLLKEADTNQDGKIQFSEFVDWLMAPAAMSLGRAVIGYSDCFKPLFDVYDKDASGFITPQHFEECHLLIQAALRLNSVDDDDFHHSDPLDLEHDHTEVFEIIDKTGDGKISFLEFVDWMRDHIPKGMDKADLKEFIVDLSKMLKSTFEHILLAEEGYIKESESHVLAGVVKKLAASTQKFYDSLKVKAQELQLQWTEPPVGLNIDRLKATHMGVVPLNMKRVKNVSWEVMCLPLPGEYVDPEARIWLAEVERRVTYKTGREAIEEPEYYVYDRKTFSWTTCSKTSNPQFHTILKGITPGIGVFCLLKTAANFGTKIKWDQVMNAMEGAVDMKFILQDQMDSFLLHMEDFALESMKSEGLIDDGMSRDSQLKAAEEWLSQSYSMAPREVMAILSELLILEVDPAWADWVDHDQVKRQERRRSQLGRPAEDAEA
jgi:Ca2+-binding EF-hand superfamily protein